MGGTGGCSVVSARPFVSDGRVSTISAAISEISVEIVVEIIKTPRKIAAPNRIALIRVLRSNR